MIPGRTMSPECVMDVFALITHALASAGDREPLGNAAALAMEVVERVERDIIERRKPVPDPFPN